MGLWRTAYPSGWQGELDVKIGTVGCDSALCVLLWACWCCAWFAMAAEPESEGTHDKGNLLPQSRRNRDGSGGFAGRPSADPVWSAFLEMIEAYQGRRDDQALVAGERWLAFDSKEEKTYWQARAIIAELQRRKKLGTFGKPPREIRPADFKDWDVAKMVAHLIDVLDDVDAWQRSYPGEVLLVLDPRVEALIDIGDPAVPGLIDAVEKDERLTRSVHAWRPWAKDRTVLSVRAAALEAVTNILKTRFFRTGVLGDSITKRGPERVQGVVAELRGYWKTHGENPFTERMMKILTDSKSDGVATAGAARNLTQLGTKWRYSGGGMMTFDISRGQSGWPVPVLPTDTSEVRHLITQFSNPTVAEAILDAMDRHLKQFDAEARWIGQHPESTRAKIEDCYLNALLRLGDRRAAPLLIQRYRSATDPHMGRRWACTAHPLGDSDALKEYARDLAGGKFPLPPGKENSLPGDRARQPDIVELQGIVGDLATVAIPEVNQALQAMTDPKHPYYRLLSRQLLYASYQFGGNGAWIAHPYCLKLLRRELDNVKEGRSDCAAEKLRDLVFGLPVSQQKAEQDLAALKRTFDSFSLGYRRVTPAEQRALHTSFWQATYIPDMAPLGRAANEEDVRAGRAIFHLQGRGKLTNLALPATASLRGRVVTDEGRRSDHRVLIVQAEADSDGNMLYGIIGDGPGRIAKTEELTDITPIKKPQ